MDMNIRERLGIKKDRAQSLVLFTSTYFDDPPLIASYVPGSNLNMIPVACWERFSTSRLFVDHILPGIQYDIFSFLREFDQLIGKTRSGT